MQWYYSVRGDAARHGLVDEKTLFEMARTGQLKTADLVWNKETGTAWVQASTVQELFPPEPEQSPAPEERGKRGFRFFRSLRS